MTDSGPCNTWVTHDPSTFIDDSTIYSFSGSTVEYTGGLLQAQTYDSTGKWTFALPSIVLPTDGSPYQIEVTFETSGYDPGDGLNAIGMFSLASVDPAVESTVFDDFNGLADNTSPGTTSTQAGAVWTLYLGPDSPYGASYTSDVIGKGYRYVMIQASGVSTPPTKIAQIRSMLVCDVAGGPNFRRRGRGSPLRRYPRSPLRRYPTPPSTQDSNRRAGGYQ